MGLRMASAWKHPKTGKWWYRKAVPPDLKAKHKELAAMGIKTRKMMRCDAGTEDAMKHPLLLMRDKRIPIWGQGGKLALAKTWEGL